MRLVKIDSKRVIVCFIMKISKRGCLKLICVKLCVEDFFLKFEINVDVFKEVIILLSIELFILIYFCLFFNFVVGEDVLFYYVFCIG